MVRARGATSLKCTRTIQHGYQVPSTDRFNDLVPCTVPGTCTGTSRATKTEGPFAPPRKRADSRQPRARKFLRAKLHWVPAFP